MADVAQMTVGYLWFGSGEFCEPSSGNLKTEAENSTETKEKTLSPKAIHNLVLLFRVTHAISQGYCVGLYGSTGGPPGLLSHDYEKCCISGS
jgi:hypothetical protein